MWHIQIGVDWKIKVSYNSYHKKLEYGWFKLYPTNKKSNAPEPEADKICPDCGQNWSKHGPCPCAELG